MHADLKFSAEFDLSGSGTVGLDIDCDLAQLDAVDQLLVWDLLNRALSVSAPLLSADANGLVDADRPPGPGELTTATASSGGGGQAQPESADTPTATPAPAASTPTASSSAGYKCTDCQRSFKTYGGLRVHQGRVHAAAATEPGGGVASEPTVDQPDANGSRSERPSASR